MILQDKSFLIITNPLQGTCHGSQVTGRMCFCHSDLREKSPHDTERDFLTSLQNDAVSGGVLSFRPQGEISLRCGMKFLHIHPK